MPPLHNGKWSQHSPNRSAAHDDRIAAAARSQQQKKKERMEERKKKKTQTMLGATSALSVCVYCIVVCSIVLLKWSCVRGRQGGRQLETRERLKDRKKKAFMVLTLTAGCTGRFQITYAHTHSYALYKRSCRRRRRRCVQGLRALLLFLVHFSPTTNCLCSPFPVM